jgi:DNA-binding GntR family transcriptional regulator
MSSAKAAAPAERLAETVYGKVKEELFNFTLMPGERFSENEVAQRLGVSRTPVREALYRLGQEGYIRVATKSGWTVNPLDFEYFDDLYDARVVIEVAAAQRLCELVPMPELDALRDAWLVPQDERLTDESSVSVLDERFHTQLVASAGNGELARMHASITERIRVLRRLDFMYPDRVRATYTEHGQILRAILRRKTEQAALLLRAHIEESKAEVRKISLHKLFVARTGAVRPSRPRA